ncbi:MAG: N-acetylglucosaminyldiphosphodolichol N-acetylglucosaminyltransferase catalytic subunit alg13 [Icmadophila ericetorum]|nr:N-acetylglucosaminyldiphosphodolichol N-acetylglucosaminyltransferase catalytic subunit alg13 [Icmadophila ericetorum]
MSSNIKTKKVCFVTIGATAGFNALIQATLSAAFLEALKASGYTDLRLQYGKDGEKFLKTYQASIEGDAGIKVSGFDFNKEGLGWEMRACKGEDGETEGVVISHAGSGSILASLRIAVPIIVVPNPALLDNHQVELAEALAAQGYVIHGHLNDLPSALRKCEASRKKSKNWPPPNRGHDPLGKGLAGVMDDEMGFVD